MSPDTWSCRTISSTSSTATARRPNSTTVWHGPAPTSRWPVPSKTRPEASGRSLLPGGRSLPRRICAISSGAWPTERHRKPATDPTTSEPPDDSEWQHELLAVLRKMDPDAFERLCRLVLRESGFSKVEVTGRSGDGGIDGAGVLRVNLISFRVRFQCKRYAGSVQVREIRDFRGAMVGRADKGLFMTTGGFTSGAAREAVRDGAPAIDLVDGVALCGLLKRLELMAGRR